MKEKIINIIQFVVAFIVPILIGIMSIIIDWKHQIFDEGLIVFWGGMMLLFILSWCIKILFEHNILPIYVYSLLGGFVLYFMLRFKLLRDLFVNEDIWWIAIFCVIGIIFILMLFFLVEFKIKKYGEIRDIIKWKTELKQYEEKLKLYESELNEKRKEKSFKDNVTTENKKLEERKQEICELISNNSLLKYMPEAMADAKTLFYEKIEHELRTKSHPAIKSAEVVSDLRKKTKEAIIKERIATYTLQSLLIQFPKLKLVVEEYKESGIEENINRDLQDIEESVDLTRQYLSDDEYNKLSITDRNQLALERYVTGKKSNWEIGRDYEMSCAYFLQKENFDIRLNGIEQRYEDLGRDLIAYKDGFGYFVIQCKYWSTDRKIHENVIMQLYGTYIAFCIETKENKVQPVLMIPTSAVLTETALQYAEMLRVKIKRLNMMDFPRIKCNINGKEKIYHLPFDQQYDKTKIENEGEFYAFTVKEAEQKGFRRARRYNQKTN